MTSQLEVLISRSNWHNTDRRNIHLRACKSHRFPAHQSFHLRWPQTKTSRALTRTFQQTQIFQIFLNTITTWPKFLRRKSMQNCATKLPRMVSHLMASSKLGSIIQVRNMVSLILEKEEYAKDKKPPIYLPSFNKFGRSC